MNETENLNKQKARDVCMRTLVLSLVILSSTLIFPFFVSKDPHKHDSPWELWGKWFYLRTLALPGSASGKEPACQYSHKRHGFDPWVGKIPWRRDRLLTPVILGFPGGSIGKESACNVGDLGLTPGLGRSPGGGHGNPVQYPCLMSPMDRGAWWTALHGVAKSHTWLSF